MNVDDFVQWVWAVHPELDFVPALPDEVAFAMVNGLYAEGVEALVQLSEPGRLAVAANLARSWDSSYDEMSPADQSEVACFIADHDETDWVAKSIANYGSTGVLVDTNLEVSPTDRRGSILDALNSLSVPPSDVDLLAGALLEASPHSRSDRTWLMVQFTAPLQALVRTFEQVIELRVSNPRLRVGRRGPVVETGLDSLGVELSLMHDVFLAEPDATSCVVSRRVRRLSEPRHRSR